MAKPAMRTKPATKNQWKLVMLLLLRTNPSSVGVNAEDCAPDQQRESRNAEVENSFKGHGISPPPLQGRPLL